MPNAQADEIQIRDHKDDWHDGRTDAQVYAHWLTLKKISGDIYEAMSSTADAFGMDDDLVAEIVDNERERRGLLPVIW